MHRKTVFIGCTICLVFVLQGTAQQAREARELNSGWQFHKVGTNDWHDASVPGCVHTDLLANKLIQDPFYRDNESKLSWIDKCSWEYRTRFEADKALLEREHIILDFKGLDTYAEVFLNDQQLLTTDDMFCEWEKDVKPYLKSGSNELRILFHSPMVMGILSRDRFDLAAPQGYNLDFTNSDWPAIGPYTRKAGYMYGWDWGPKLTTSGIWKPVYLVTWDNARLKQLQVFQQKVSAKQADLRVHISIEASAALAATIRLKYGLPAGPSTEKSLALKLHQGINDTALNVSISNPSIWWPNGLGNHPVYAFESTLSIGNTNVDRKLIHSGFREVKLVQSPQPDGGKSFYFEVNGIPVFAKGANYIPSDIFPSRVTPQHYKELIQAAADAHMNMLRVWGGGIYESDEFYDLCDEYGIMVWQDFAFSIFQMPDYPEFYTSIRHELKDNILRLRNHPSIVLWCGNNETDMLWDILMKKFFGLPLPKEVNMLGGLVAMIPTSPLPVDSAVTQRVIKAYDDVFYGIIPEALSKFDENSHPYWPSSPMGGWKKPLTLSGPQSGDTHFYIAVLKLPFSAYQDVRSHFFSEHGFQAWPDKKAVYEFTSVSDRSANSKVMEAHNKASGGNALLNKYFAMYYKTPKDFDSYLYISQVLQAEGIKMALETHRSWMPYTMGSLYWQLNDVWPVASWSSMDYKNRPKALQYFVTKAFSPVIVVPVNHQNEFKLNVVSDLLQAFHAVLDMQISDFNGKVLWHQSVPVDMDTNASKLVFKSATDKLVGGFDTTNIVFSAKLKKGKELLASNVEYFSLPKNLNLKKTEIRKKVVATGNGYTITLSSETLAKNVYLSTDADGKFSDNFFDMLPGEKVTVLFSPSGKEGNFVDSLKIMSLVDSY